jgi:hypothetical protein
MHARDMAASLRALVANAPEKDVFEAVKQLM